MIFTNIVKAYKTSHPRAETNLATCGKYKLGEGNQPLFLHEFI